MFLAILLAREWRGRILFWQDRGTRLAELAVFGRECRVFGKSWTFSDVNVDGVAVLLDCNSNRPNRLVIPMHSSNKIGRVYHTAFQSPLGQLLLAGNDRGLRLISFAAGKHVVRPQPGWMENKEPFQETIRQLQAYFCGELQQFDLPLALEGTPFQVRVWQSLRAIPYGQTISYGQLAHQIGQPGAARAVGRNRRRRKARVLCEFVLRRGCLKCGLLCVVVTTESDRGGAKITAQGFAGGCPWLAGGVMPFMRKYSTIWP